MKRILTLVLAASMALTMLASCSSKPAESSSQAESSQASSEVSSSSEASSSEAASSETSDTTEFVIKYPSYMQETEGDALVLEKKPEKIICLSNSAMQILIKSDIKPIAFRNPTSYIDWPEWVHELPMIETGMSGLDVEKVVSMEPDLVIMGAHLKEDYDQQLKDAGIPVYYTSEGPAIAYNEVREEAITLSGCFGGEELAKQIEADFVEVEKRCEDYKKTHETKKAMILFGAPPSNQSTSMSYFGSILNLLPFENISDTLVDPESRMAPIDMEKLVEINPEVIFAYSPTARTADDIKQVYEEEIQKNPQLWNALDAVKNDKVIYLPGEYVTSKGIHIINSINNLMDMLDAKFPADGAETTAPSTEGVTINYPANMQERGYTQPLVLEKTPEKIVCMSKSPVLALYELGVKMIAIPNSGVMAWPEDLDKATEKINTGMNSNFDIETVIAMEPDLVIMGYTSQDKHGKALEDAGIPVYYVDAGHTVPYESVRAQTVELINAFGKDSEAGKKVMAGFTDLEKRLAGMQDKYSDKSVMVLQSAPPSHYIQTEGGTLASMAKMMGFKNVYENDKTSMAPLDMEVALEYDPDLVLCVGGSASAADHEKLMKEDFAKNPDYWNSIEAIKNGDMLCFPAEYIASTGIGFIDSMNEFIETIEAFYAAK